jgi:hypothetical protein
MVFTSVIAPCFDYSAEKCIAVKGLSGSGPNPTEISFDRVNLRRKAYKIKIGSIKV